MGSKILPVGFDPYNWTNIKEEAGRRLRHNPRVLAMAMDVIVKLQALSDANQMPGGVVQWHKVDTNGVTHSTLQQRPYVVVSESGRQDIINDFNNLLVVGRDYTQGMGKWVTVSLGCCVLLSACQQHVDVDVYSIDICMCQTACTRPIATCRREGISSRNSWRS